MSLSYQKDDEAAAVDGSSSSLTKYPIPLYATIIVVAIVIITVIQIVTGEDASIRAAGFDKVLFRQNQDYWRILTGATVHGGSAHVAMNGYALYSIGKILEVLTNRAHLAIVFLLSALGGGILSLMFVPDGTSVGASGGIVGLLGYLAIYAFRRREFISPEFRKSLLINIVFILVFGLILFRVIDNFAHIGGLVAGLFYGFAQIPSDPKVDPREASSAVQFAGLASLGIYLAACIFSVLLILRVV
jgi:membrane associated rhomboid family serine protease